jgi:hypothetical protein
MQALVNITLIVGSCICLYLNFSKKYRHNETVQDAVFTIRTFALTPLVIESLFNALLGLHWF